jgi:hypothetical protein
MTELSKWLKAKRGRGAWLARKLDVTHGAILKFASEQVPGDRVLHIQALTGLSVKKLRPDMVPAKRGKN